MSCGCAATHSSTKSTRCFSPIRHLTGGRAAGSSSLDPASMTDATTVAVTTPVHRRRNHPAGSGGRLEISGRLRRDLEARRSVPRRVDALARVLDDRNHRGGRSVTAPLRALVRRDRRAIDAIGLGDLPSDAAAQKESRGQHFASHRRPSFEERPRSPIRGFGRRVVLGCAVCRSRRGQRRCRPVSVAVTR